MRKAFFLGLFYLVFFSCTVSSARAESGCYGSYLSSAWSTTSGGYQPVISWAPVVGQIANAQDFFPIEIAIPETGYSHQIQFSDCDISRLATNSCFINTAINGPYSTFNIPFGNGPKDYTFTITSQVNNGIQISCQETETINARNIPTVGCGQTFTRSSEGDSGVCPSGCPVAPFQTDYSTGVQTMCCGNVQNGQCTSTLTTGGSGGITGVTSGTFDSLNQAIFSGAPAVELTTPRGIISRALPYLFTFGGIILFVMILWGGFEMLGGAANPKSQEAGKQRITAAVIGFVLLFVSYWFAQIVQIIFGISIL